MQTNRAMEAHCFQCCYFKQNCLHTQNILKDEAKCCEQINWQTLRIKRRLNFDNKQEVMTMMI